MIIVNRYNNQANQANSGNQGRKSWWWLFIAKLYVIL